MVISKHLAAAFPTNKAREFHASFQPILALRREMDNLLSVQGLSV